MLSLMRLHNSIEPWSWLGTMVYSGHNLVCKKRSNNLEFVQRPAPINFECIPPFDLLLN